MKACGAAALLALSVAAGAFFSPTSPFQRGAREDFAQYVSLGEALLHGVDSPEGTVSSRMPLSTVQAALFFSHGGAWRRKAAEAAPLLLVPALVFALGALLGGPLWGCAAAVLFELVSLTDRDGFLWTYPQNYYSVYFLLVAALGVWSLEEKPGGKEGLRRRALLGAAVGLSLLVRSALALLPPLLLFLEAASLAPKDRKKCAVSLAALAALPYLVLLPIIRTNGILHGQWFAFEWGPPDNNIITGAWGLVPTVASDWRSFVDNPPVLERYGDALRWALKRVAEHPWTYLYSCFARVGYVLALKPLLWTAAAAGIWLLRKEKAARLLGWLCLYFVGLHCLMSVRGEYFVPLWPLLCVPAAYALLSGASYTARWKGGRANTVPFWSRWAVRFVLCLSALGGMLGLRGLAAEYAYGSAAARRDPGSGEALKDALAASPEDAWLLASKGRRALREGRPVEAEAELSRALARRPWEEDWALELAWAQRAQGRPEPMLRYRPRTLDNKIKAGIGRYLALRQAGRAEDAAKELNGVLTAWREDRLLVHRLASGLDKEVQAKLRRQDDTVFLEETFNRWGEILSSGDRVLMLDGFAGRGTSKASLYLDQAEYALRHGSVELAKALLGRARTMGRPLDQTRRLARLYFELGEPEAALVATREAVSAHAGETGLLIDLAEFSSEEDPSSARRTADRALAASPSPEDILRLAHLHQKWKDYARAIELLEPLTREEPWRARALKDQGICEFYAGAADRAAARLEEALEAEPGLLSAALSLGAVYSSLKEPDKEREVYRRALAAAPVKEEREMRAIIRDNLRRLEGGRDG